MGKGHKLVSKKGKMVNFKLGETDVKILIVSSPVAKSS